MINPRDLEKALPRNIGANVIPFPKVGRKGTRFRAPRLPRPSQVRVGRSNQLPPPPPAPKPAPSPAATSVPAAPPSAALKGTKENPPLGGLARRIPKTGDAERLRDALHRIAGEELGRRVDALPADRQRYRVGRLREFLRGLDVEEQNAGREADVKGMEEQRANRPQTRTYADITRANKEAADADRRDKINRLRQAMNRPAAPMEAFAANLGEHEPAGLAELKAAAEATPGPQAPGPPPSPERASPTGRLTLPDRGAGRRVRSPLLEGINPDPNATNPGAGNPARHRRRRAPIDPDVGE